MHSVRKFGILSLVFLTAFGLGCGAKRSQSGTSAGGTTTTTGDNGSGITTDQLTGAGLNGYGEVIGTVYAPSGDPVSGATIYIPIGERSTGASSTRTYTSNLIAEDGTVCADPGEQYCAVACANADGTFTMDTTSCTGSHLEMVIQKGNLIMTIVLDCTSGTLCTLASNESTFGGNRGYTTYPKVAVVTGDLDRMQDVIAKIAPLAYGSLDSNNHLAPGNENTNNITFIDGNGDLTGLTSYDTFDKYLNEQKSLSGFDILFINCATKSEYESLLSSTSVKKIFTDYVNGGGILYVTDLSYDYVNQPFPEFAKFHGSVSASSPGQINAAQHGNGGDSVNAKVNTASLAGWLQTVTVIANSSGGPGNSDSDCKEAGSTYSTRTGALNQDGTIPIGELLNNWALIDDYYDSETTIVISSGSTALDSLTNRPLTMVRNVGNGLIIYSSYHTSDSCPSPYFWPQERVLQYLIFEAF